MARVLVVALYVDVIVVLLVFGLDRGRSRAILSETAYTTFRKKTQI
jgi:hypothetical protein